MGDPLQPPSVIVDAWRAAIGGLGTLMGALILRLISRATSINENLVSLQTKVKETEKQLAEIQTRVESLNSRIDGIMSSMVRQGERR